MKTSTRKQQAAPKALPVTEVTGKKAEVKPAEKKAELRRLYVGPTIYGIARNGSVYIGIPSAVGRVRKEVPDLVNLFIPITDYGKATEQIRKGVGYIGVAYKHAEVYAAKVRNGGIR